MWSEIESGRKKPLVRRKVVILKNREKKFDNVNKNHYHLNPMDVLDSITLPHDELPLCNRGIFYARSLLRVVIVC